MGIAASGRAAELTAVERLYRRYARDVFSLAYHSVGSRADAEDVAQTTFLNAHRALLKGAEPADDRAWLLAIARNACRTRFRTQRRRPREEPLDESLFASHTDSEPSPRTLDALNALRPRQRDAIIMQTVEGCTTAEIGTRLGLGPSAVDALLFRARAALRDELQARAEPVLCADVETLVDRQLRHELAADEQAGLRAHLRTCASCAASARRLRGRKRALALLLLPWDLVGRFTGLFGQGGATVKAAAVVGALTIGTTAVFETTAPWANRSDAPPQRSAPSIPTRADTELTGARLRVPVAVGRTRSGPGVSRQRARQAARNAPAAVAPAEHTATGRSDAPSAAGDAPTASLPAASPPTASNPPAAPDPPGAPSLSPTPAAGPAQTSAPPAPDLGQLQTGVIDPLLDDTVATVQGTLDDTVATVQGTLDDTVATVQGTLDDTVATVNGALDTVEQLPAVVPGLPPVTLPQLPPVNVPPVTLPPVVVPPVTVPPLSLPELPPLLPGKRPHEQGV